MKHLVLLVLLSSSSLLVTACSKDKDGGKPASSKKGSPDWGDDPRPLGSCVGVAKPGVTAPDGSKPEYCLETQTEQECNSPSSKMDYSYAEHTTCASRGYPKKCAGGDYPDSARFKACPANTTDPTAAATPAAPSPNLDAAKEVVGIFEKALAAADETKADCTAFGKKLDAIRGRLWDLGKQHPGLFGTLSDAELKSIKAADTVEALTNKLMPCSENVHAKEFAFALTKVIKS
jgi:hypothetical protein